MNGNVFSKKWERFNTITAHYGRPRGHLKQELCMLAKSREALCQISLQRELLNKSQL